MQQGRSILILVPAFNEEACIGSVVAEIRAAAPGLPVLVVSDGSRDGTAAAARAAGATVLDLPCNLGVGGAVQAGFQYAAAQGFDAVIRLDGDGQHAPADIPRFLAALDAQPADLLLGSRFLEDGGYRSTRLRHCGIVALAAFLSLICRQRVTDPTSGFQLIRRPLLDCFARDYPEDYPEPEALARLRRLGYDFAEVPATFRKRQTGASSIQGWDTFYYVVKVFLALVIDRARPVDPRLSRSRMLLTREAG